jgi:hypothetical protein
VARTELNLAMQALLKNFYSKQLVHTPPTSGKGAPSIPFVHTLEPNWRVCSQIPNEIKVGGMRSGGRDSMEPALAGALHIDDDDTLPLRSVGFTSQQCADCKNATVH